MFFIFHHIEKTIENLFSRSNVGGSKFKIKLYSYVLYIYLHERKGAINSINY